MCRVFCSLRIKETEEDEKNNNLLSAHHCFMAMELGTLISHVAFQTKHH